MKSLLLIITLSICLLTTPSLAWEKFDGQITERTVYMSDTPEEQITVTTIEHPAETTVMREPVIYTVSPEGAPMAKVEVELDPVSGIHVYDADDSYLGLLFSKSSPGSTTISVYDTTLEKFMFIDLYVETISPVNLYFENSDCTGEPLMIANYRFQINAAHFPDNNCEPEFFTGDTTHAPDRITTQSVFIYSVDDGITDCSCRRLTRDDWYVPAVEIPSNLVPFIGDHPTFPLRFETGLK